MTTYYFSMTADQADGNPSDVTTGTTSATGADIEVRVPIPGGSGANMNRGQMVRALENILDRIVVDATVLPVI